MVYVRLFSMKLAVVLMFTTLARTAECDDTTTATTTDQNTVLNSQQWDDMRQSFQKWLSVQQLYSPDEVTAIVNELNQGAMQMSESDRKRLLEDMQQRLEVLMSPQAEEARQWISRFRSVARDPDERMRQKRPDVMNMTAAQIRDELNSFERERRAEERAQSAFQRTRQLQTEAAMGAHAARRDAQQQVADSRNRAAVNAQARSPYAPRPQDLPNFTDFEDITRLQTRSPYHTVGPWGNPIRWHPLYGYWW